VQKSGLITVISGVLIIIGLVLLVIENQLILEGVNQENGKVSSSQTITVSVDFDMERTSMGVFAVQAMEFKENTLLVKLLDPFDIEIISQEINEEIIEREFDVLESGTYKLLIQSNSDEEIHVFGAIGPLPDANKKLIGFISTYVLIAGMAGLVGSGIYVIKNRKRSI